jgi:hypothetical protein
MVTLVIEEQAALMCSERMRSMVAKKEGSSFSLRGGMEDIAKVEEIINDADSPPFEKVECEGGRDPGLPPGECSGEVQS